MKKLIYGVSTAAIILVTFGTIYAAVQQSQRSEANYPQIQMAEDVAAEINGGEIPVTLVDSVNIRTSLAPFTVVYDKKGQPILSSGTLDGKAPKAPLGVLRAAQGKEYNAVTWEPKDGVRLATVSVAAKGYYVLSGRSLREVEKNETRTLEIAVLGGIVSMLILGAAIIAKLVSREYA